MSVWTELECVLKLHCAVSSTLERSVETDWGETFTARIYRRAEPPHACATAVAAASAKAGGGGGGGGGERRRACTARAHRMRSTRTRSELHYLADARSLSLSLSRAYCGILTRRWCSCCGGGARWFFSRGDTRRGRRDDARLRGVVFDWWEIGRRGRALKWSG